MREWVCQRDGACCTIPAAVVMTAAEWDELQTVTPMRPVAIDTHDGMVALKAAPCPFYDFRRASCVAYEKRPYNCRRFQCGRWEPSREPFRDAAPMTLYRGDNDLRWAYQKNDRAHHEWARSHGWPI